MASLDVTKSCSHSDLFHNVWIVVLYGSFLLTSEPSLLSFRRR